MSTCSDLKHDQNIAIQTNVDHCFKAHSTVRVATVLIVKTAFAFNDFCFELLVLCAGSSVRISVQDIQDSLRVPSIYY